MRRGRAAAKILALLRGVPILSSDDAVELIDASRRCVFDAIGLLRDVGVLRALTDSPTNQIWGLAARLSWRGVEHPVGQLAREVLLPAAADGLDAWGVDATDRDRSSVSSKRGFDAAVPALPGRPKWCATSRSAGWSASRRYARYVEHAHPGAPVHEWPVP